tara:strand:- start:1 stop:204 length:204 start_codon:yes stop_codon:yes gene_type:complete
MSEAKKIFREILALEKERNEALKEYEAILGFDISFSDEDVLKNAKDTLKARYKEKAPLIIMGYEKEI